ADARHAGRAARPALDPGFGIGHGTSRSCEPDMPHAYFDHNATTPVDPRVLEAMLPWLRDEYGNASSRHEPGTRARRAIDAAREQVAALVNVQPSQVVFTS